MNQWGIRTRVTLLAVGPAVLLACVLAGYFTFSRIADAEDALRRLGESTAQHLAASAEYGVVTGNQTLLEGLVRSAVKDAQTRYALITDAAMMPLAAAGKAPANPGGYVFKVPIVIGKVDVDDAFDLDGGAPASGNPAGADKPVGWVTVAMSRTALDQGRSRMLITGFGIVVAGILVTGALAAGWGASISRPVRELSRAVEALERGHLGARVAPLSGGELLLLQTGFNRMAGSLQTHQAELQRRVQEATADLEEKKEEAERANKAKSGFLAAVSHDLRQPMHAVGLFAATLRERVTTPEQMELVQRIEDSLSALQGMFDSLLNISRLDAGVVEPYMQCCDLKQILNRVWQDYQPLAAQKNLNLRVRTRPAWCMSDPLLLSRMIGNLVANAVRYTEQGGILVGCRRRGDRWLIQVWDTGIGIPAQHLPYVFEEYYQVGNEERNRARGVGLGLAIVRKIAQILGHEVTVRSWMGKGSVFAISVNATVEQAVERRVPGQRDIGQFASEHVLVIDDDPDARDSMSRLLVGWGLRPVAVDGAEAAMAYLRDGKDPPRLIVCDYRLPRVTGIELIRTIRAELGRELPALIVTGETAADSVAAMQASGLAVLHKPVRPAKLRALISALLEGAPAG